MHERSPFRPRTLSPAWWLAALGAAATVFLFLPLVVYSANPASVEIPKQSIALVGVAFTLFSVTCLAGISMATRAGEGLARLSRVVLFALFWLAVFPNHTGEFTGFERPEELLGETVAAAKLLGLVLAGMVWSGRKPDTFSSVAGVLAGVTLAACAGMLAFSQSARDAAPKPDANALAAFHELGSEANIIVLVLDGFTGYRLAEIFAQRPELQDAFTGFTYYPRAIAPAHNTPAGISATLTGDLRLATDEDDVQARLEQSLASSFLADAETRGYEAAFISRLVARSDTIATIDEQRFHAQPAGLSSAALGSYWSFLSVSGYRVLPAVLAARLQDAIQDLFLALAPARAGGDSDLQRTLDLAARVPIHGHLAFNSFVDSLVVTRAQRKALFLHSKLSHAPWNFAEDGRVVPHIGWRTSSVFAVHKMRELLEKLRVLGAYDDSLIVITSDHGSMPLDDFTMGGALAAPDPNFVYFNPLLLVKPAGAHGPLEIDPGTAWLGDVQATVRDHLGLGVETATGNRSLLEDVPDDRRVQASLFFSPYDASMAHAALKAWDRVSVHGSFTEFAAVARRRAWAAFDGAGSLRLSVGPDVGNGDANSACRGRAVSAATATVALDGLELFALDGPGVLVIAARDGIPDIRWFDDTRAGLAFYAASREGGETITVGVGVPSDEAGIEHAVLPGAGDAGRHLNLVAVDAAGRRSLVRTCEGPMAVQVAWPGWSP